MKNHPVMDIIYNEIWDGDIRKYKGSNITENEFIRYKETFKIGKR